MRFNFKLAALNSWTLFDIQTSLKRLQSLHVELNAAMQSTILANHLI